MTLKRGFMHQESMEYVGVKRRAFDEVWHPKLVAMRHGASLVFDCKDLDRLFDEFKQSAAGHSGSANNLPDQPIPAQTKDQNVWPIKSNGVQKWDKARVVAQDFSATMILSCLVDRINGPRRRRRYASLAQAQSFAITQKNHGSCAEPHRWARIPSCRLALAACLRCDRTERNSRSNTRRRPGRLITDQNLGRSCLK